VTVSTANVASGCTADYPARLRLVPENQQEAAILDTLVGCTSRTNTGAYFKNTHDSAVWVIDRPALTWEKTSSALDVALFRGEMKLRGLAGLTLEPGQAVSIRSVDPTTVHLRIDARGQGSWQVLELARDTVQNKLTGAGEDALVKLLGNGSPSRTAVLTCMKQAYDVGNQVAGANVSNRLERFENLLGLAQNVTGCGKAVSAAQLEEARPTLTLDEMARMTRSSARWKAADSLFGYAGKFVKILEAVH
jgi:hypothetical protein